MEWILGKVLNHISMSCSLLGGHILKTDVLEEHTKLSVLVQDRIDRLLVHECTRAVISKAPIK
jgi:hypothetical protein